ncbi:UdgX family uracil-DNA binding protein [Cellulomonas xylanilytica]|uniref:Type-4 uracil-DNA glycosylase n=1 Tax=Cellulomonas xylanilytica TaxID=233583 RepID=A0A510V2D4_9CELL|nr:UdgX family uracil-DNA binding protein [Cellulomonas xylanilytica]GEK21053.1 uracil-DNA glycosylase [Cellulomonas xylanilytica]
MSDTSAPGAARWVPPTAGLEDLRAAAPACRGCELWRPATQVVFSRGPAAARVVLVGEQPGDREDLEGEPFVGPAGRLLSDALREAGIDEDAVYLTNAVKHFRFEQRGKRRLHKTPTVTHLRACAPWLEAELAVLDPQVVVALGATAGHAVLGRPVKVAQERGRLLEGRYVLTAHPSAVVRLRGRDGFDEAFAELVSDLRLAAS